MPILDMTLHNPKILAFFDGTSEIKPIGEFMYVHTHPKVRNFMSEIEGLVNFTSSYIQANPGKTHLAHRLLYLAEQYSSHISDVTEASAGHMLVVLKEIYQICVKCTQDQVEEVQEVLRPGSQVEQSVEVGGQTKRKTRSRKGAKSK